jgi:hypothetical protein
LLSSTVKAGISSYMGVVVEPQGVGAELPAALYELT